MLYFNNIWTGNTVWHANVRLIKINVKKILIATESVRNDVENKIDNIPISVSIK